MSSKKNANKVWTPSWLFVIPRLHISLVVVTGSCWTKKTTKFQIQYSRKILFGRMERKLLMRLSLWWKGSCGVDMMKFENKPSIRIEERSRVIFAFPLLIFLTDYQTISWEEIWISTQSSYFTNSNVYVNTLGGKWMCSILGPYFFRMYEFKSRKRWYRRRTDHFSCGVTIATSYSKCVLDPFPLNTYDGILIDT